MGEQMIKIKRSDLDEIIEKCYDPDISAEYLTKQVKIWAHQLRGGEIDGLRCQTSTTTTTCNKATKSTLPTDGRRKSLTK